MNLSPKGRLMLGGSVIAVVLLGILMMRIASAPDFTTVLAGMDPAQATDARQRDLELRESKESASNGGGIPSGIGPR